MNALTDDQINDLNLKHGWFEFGDAQSAKTKAFVRDVEALCAEKAEPELADTEARLRYKRTAFKRLVSSYEETEAVLEKAKNLFDSITCLCAEGVEFHKRHDIIMAVSKEAAKGYLLCKGGEDV